MYTLWGKILDEDVSDNAVLFGSDSSSLAVNDPL